MQATECIHLVKKTKEKQTKSKNKKKQIQQNTKESNWSEYVVNFMIVFIKTVEWKETAYLPI